MEVLCVSSNERSKCYNIFLKFGEGLYLLNFDIKIHKLLSKKFLKALIKTSRFYRVSGFDFKYILLDRRIIKEMEIKYDRDTSYSV